MGFYMCNAKILWILTKQGLIQTVIQLFIPLKEHLCILCVWYVISKKYENMKYTMHYTIKPPKMMQNVQKSANRES